MPYARFLPLSLVAAAALLLMGALSANSTPTIPAASSASLPPARPDPAAVQDLDRALDALSPDRLTWVEATIWQQTRMRDLSFQAQGRYLAGPERRFRLDLQTRAGRAEGQVRVVSDGAMVWQAVRTGSGDWSAARPIDLRKALPHLDGNNEKALLLDGFVQTQLKGGLSALVRDLRGQMVWAKRERVRRNDRPFIKLTGVWPEEVAANLTSADGSWPAGLPRMARLYLDPKTLWPHRLEWWGPDPPRQGDVLLMQMELRDPILNQPLSPDRVAREFAGEVLSTTTGGER